MTKIQLTIDDCVRREREAIVAWLDAALDRIHNDPNFFEDCEAYQRKYGTLTAEDLQKQFTI